MLDEMLDKMLDEMLDEMLDGNVGLTFASSRLMSRRGNCTKRENICKQLFSNSSMLCFNYSNEETNRLQQV